jgi:SAM-dependent methyltransferase
MRATENKYWDDVALTRLGKPGNLQDNVVKRCAIVSRLLAHRPVGARVLEIGCGQAMAAAITNLVTLANFHYVGTDVSRIFCEFVTERWTLKTVHTDILNLPPAPFDESGKYDMVWAFDTLEHVRPEDREQGYQNINNVLDEHGLILLNVPRDECHHEPEFDHGQDDADILNLARITGTQVVKWEPYHLEEINRSYLWVELQR